MRSISRLTEFLTTKYSLNLKHSSWFIVGLWQGHQRVLFSPPLPCSAKCGILRLRLCWWSIESFTSVLGLKQGKSSTDHVVNISFIIIIIIIIISVADSYLYFVDRDLNSLLRFAESLVMLWIWRQIRGARGKNIYFFKMPPFYWLLSSVKNLPVCIADCYFHAQCV